MLHFSQAAFSPCAKGHLHLQKKMQIAWRRQVIKNSVLELHIDYTTCNQELTLSKLSLHFHCAIYSPQSETRLSLLYKPEETPNPLQWKQRGRFLNKGAFPREPLCEISDLLISSELVLLLRNGVQVHKMRSSFNTFTTPQKSLHSWRNTSPYTSQQAPDYKFHTTILTFILAQCKQH